MKRKPQHVRKKRAPCPECVSREAALERLDNQWKVRARLLMGEKDKLTAELAAARDEATQLRADRDAARKDRDYTQGELRLAIDGHDSYIKSYALHSKQVLAFLDNLPMDVKGQRWMSPSKWRECVKLFEPEAPYEQIR